MDMPAFIGSWTVMMAAMMLPSAMPMIRLHRLGADGGMRRQLWSGTFIAGYLLVWGAVGIVVWAAAFISEMVMAEEQRAISVAVLLLIAGGYQFTPLKSACLRACRTPADFLMTHWYRGLGGQLRLGIEHGLYCVGCCWALMAIFVGIGAMSIAWAAAIAVVVLIEKLFPRGVAFGRVIGAILVAASFVVFVRPDLVVGVGTRM
ncbi:MAG: DUF2182 domain-containing protein [Chloroflexi bacterium]|nr:MAG: DUF2182 domain-containing protein [Chloroflexota bacterium]TMB98069.1 MAG: DUF2182 domain-containing protein [Chloroflexota bacterium]TMC30625.1 MAG: DUF2182 domain-containing protein [Chloroflexota bacterium]TMC33305.1 MAG: DUF2182 domain-containing protein [Chloroflexota bacterium]TMC55790.1 MAG: DUF2182 domain-containing protein [Chloroflexota bacterium]